MVKHRRIVNATTWNILSIGGPNHLGTAIFCPILSALTGRGRPELAELLLLFPLAAMLSAAAQLRARPSTTAASKLITMMTRIPRS